MKKTIVLLMAALLLLLYGCSSQKTAAESSAEVEVPTGEPTQEAVPSPEPTPTTPPTFMEEHGLVLSMKMSYTGLGMQYADSGSDYLTPDFCDDHRAIVFVGRTASDEEGYVTYTIISEGEITPDLIYFDADNNEESYFRFCSNSYTLIDRYTGTELPERDTHNDDAYNYTIEIQWEGRTYRISRDCSIKWDFHFQWDGPWKNGRASGRGPQYFQLKDIIRVPEDYDGLTLAWHMSEPKPHSAEDYNDELDLEEAHVLCEDDFSALSDYCFTSVDVLRSILHGGTELPGPADPDGVIDASFQAVRKEYDNEYTTYLNRFGYNYYAADEEAPDFELCGHLTGDGSTGYGGFLLANHTEDRQIAINVYDAEGHMLGSSGLLGPKEYLTHFSLDVPVPKRSETTYLIESWSYDKKTGETSVEMVEHSITPSDCAFVFCVYDLDGNFIGSTSDIERDYSNGWFIDWDSIDSIE